jgi:hypothetical protein
MVIGSCSGWPGLTLFGGLVVFICWLATWLCASHVPPDRVVFGELRTFRELATVLAGDDSLASRPTPKGA